MKNKILSLPGKPFLYYVHHVPQVIKCPYPLLFIHGLGGNAEQFELGMHCALQHGLEVYALNLEGHGPGEEPLGGTSIHDYVENIRTMLQYISRPSIFIGHSMGALVGQRVAADLGGEESANDSLMKAAVFMSSSPPKGIRLFLKEMLLPRYLFPMLRDRQIRFLPKHVRRLMMNKTPYAERYLRQMKAVSGRAVWEIATGQIGVDEKKVKCPTLLVAPEKDRTIGLRMQEKIRHKFGSDFALIPEGDHFTFLWSSKPMQLIIDWFRYKNWFYQDIDLSPTETLQLVS